MLRGGLQLESALRIATPTFLGKQATLIGKSLGPYNGGGPAGRAGLLAAYALEGPASGSRPYDVAADSRFLLLRDPQLDTASSAMITAVINWLEELKQQVPRR